MGNSAASFHKKNAKERMPCIRRVSTNAEFLLGFYMHTVCYSAYVSALHAYVTLRIRVSALHAYVTLHMLCIRRVSTYAEILSGFYMRILSFGVC